VAVQAKLRAPDGCPWDREQTHESLRTYLIEEAYEVLEALESGNDAKFAEKWATFSCRSFFIRRWRRSGCFLRFRCNPRNPRQDGSRHLFFGKRMRRIQRR
jgi:hypothetical protein